MIAQWASVRSAWAADLSCQQQFTTTESTRIASHPTVDNRMRRIRRIVISIFFLTSLLALAMLSGVAVLLAPFGFEGAIPSGSPAL
jgi:hypothetical protein